MSPDHHQERLRVTLSSPHAAAPRPCSRLRPLRAPFPPEDDDDALDPSEWLRERLREYRQRMQVGRH